MEEINLELYIFKQLEEISKEYKLSPVESFVIRNTFATSIFIMNTIIEKKTTTKNNL